MLVYVASDAAELAYRAELEASGVPRRACSRATSRPTCRRHWLWARGVRLDADGLLQVVPDIASRHAYISGPAALIADLAPALEQRPLDHDRRASAATEIRAPDRPESGRRAGQPHLERR